MKPGHTVLNILLNARLQLGLVQIKVIHSTNTQDAISGEACADAVHERAARRAKVVGHVVARANRLGLAIRRQIVAATLVRQVGIVDGEVGCEHGRGDLAAVGAVADEGVDQSGFFSWLQHIRITSTQT